MTEIKTPLTKEAIEDIIKQLTDWVTTDNNPKDRAALNLMKVALVTIRDLKMHHKRELKDAYHDGYQDGEFEAEGKRK